MALNLRIANTPVLICSFKIEQLKTGLFYDFVSKVFASKVTINSWLSIPESTEDPGCYDLTLDQTPSSIFTDGHYSIRAKFVSKSGEVSYYNYATRMINGDDAPPETLGVVLQAFWKRLKGAVIIQ